MQEKVGSVNDLRATRWWVMLGAAIAVLAIVYILAVLTPVGQSFENAALAGATQVDAVNEGEARAALDAITLGSLAAATAVVIGIGLLRRQYALAALAGAIIVGGQIISQGLKRYILPRPDLVGADSAIVENSFPSGHTTIAMTLLVAVFLVVPYRWRGVAMFVVLTWATAIGAYTITARWHRLSDTIGADMVALALGCAASVVLLRAGRVVRVTHRYVGRVVFVIGVTAAAVVALALGTFIAVSAARYPLGDEVIQWDMYLAANSLAFAFSALTALVFWWSWHRLDVAPRARRDNARAGRDAGAATSDAHPA